MWKKLISNSECVNILRRLKKLGTLVKFYCEPRDLVLGRSAKVCQICDEYKAGKIEYPEEVLKNIVDYLTCKRRRKSKRWSKKKKKKDRRGRR